MDINKEINFKVNGEWVKELLVLTEDDDYYYYHTKNMRDPLISSHTLINLCNLNKWNSPGKTLMTMFGINKRSKIDPYQTRKGGIAEEFASRYISKKFGPMADIEEFTTSQFKNFNQFPDQAPFSGVLDLMMHSPDKMTIEVKSKEMKDYEMIAVNNMFPREQVTQGANQAILAGTTKYTMVWIFLKPSVSKYLKAISDQDNDVWMWDDNFKKAVEDLEIEESDFKYYSKEFDADERIINAYRKKALDIVNDFKDHRRISKKLFKATERLAIKRFIEAQNPF